MLVQCGIHLNYCNDIIQFILCAGINKFNVNKI